jgi:hypothetical protein
MGAQVLVRVRAQFLLSATGQGVQFIAGPCKILGAVGVAEWSRGQILNVRHAVFLSSDGTRDKIGLQNGCFPTARLAQPRAAKFRWFAAVCLH